MYSQWANGSRCTKTTFYGTARVCAAVLHSMLLFWFFKYAWTRGVYLLIRECVFCFWVRRFSIDSTGLAQWQRGFRHDRTPVQNLSLICFNNTTEGFSWLSEQGLTDLSVSLPQNMCILIICKRIFRIKVSNEIFCLIFKLSEGVLQPTWRFSRWELKRS